MFGACSLRRLSSRRASAAPSQAPCKDSKSNSGSSVHGLSPTRPDWILFVVPPFSCSWVPFPNSKPHPNSRSGSLLSGQRLPWASEPKPEFSSELQWHSTGHFMKVVLFDLWSDLYLLIYGKFLEDRCSFFLFWGHTTPRWLCENWRLQEDTLPGLMLWSMPTGMEKEFPSIAKWRERRVYWDKRCC